MSAQHETGTATGQELAEMNIPELLEGTGARFVRGWVTAVDADAKTVRIDDEQVLHYDTLVYGLGSVADTAAVEDHAYSLNGVQVRSGVEVVKVPPDSAELAGGENIAADVFLWTSGTRVSLLAPRSTGRRRSSTATGSSRTGTEPPWFATGRSAEKACPDPPHTSAGRPSGSSSSE